MKGNYKEIKRPKFHNNQLEEDIGPLPSKRFFKIKFSYLLLLISALIFAAVYFYSYKYTIKPVNIEDLPLIKRDTSYIRIIPEDKGGMVFSNQDKEIYNSIANQNLFLDSRTIQIEEPESEKVSDLISRLKNTQNELQTTIQDNNKNEANKNSLNSIFDVIKPKEKNE